MQINASTALVEVVRIAPVIPKHASLWNMLSFLLALAVGSCGKRETGGFAIDSSNSV